MIYCHICYSKNVEEEFICDRFGEYYCEECSYTYTIHFQYEGALCYWCSDQNRKKLLTKDMIRENKISLFIDVKR